jgi:hypothetical protein
MIVVKLMGGLGNQMFQYATGRALALKSGDELFLDTSFLEKDTAEHTYRKFALGHFNISAQLSQEDFSHLDINNRIKNKIVNTISGRKNLNYVKEKSFRFDRHLFDRPSNVYLDGYWQSEKYFNSYEEQIRNDFSLNTRMSDRNEEWKKKITGTESLFIHVRRGDYVSNPAANSFHGICDLSYYVTAIAKLNMLISNPVYYVFSDDIAWTAENLKIDAENYIVSSQRSDAVEEMYLMAHCKHGIIANSSFSWWGAWLISNRQKKIIAPLNWFADSSLDITDLIPASWQKI